MGGDVFIFLFKGQKVFKESNAMKTDEEERKFYLFDYVNVLGTLKGGVALSRLIADFKFRLG